MTTIRLTTILAVAPILLGTARAEEVKIKAKDVPSAATALAAKEPGRVTLWEKDTKDGKVFYEATVKGPQGEWQLIFDASGAFVAKEQDVAVKNLPAAVRDAVVKKYAGATIVAAEKITRAGGEEFEVTLKNAQSRTMVIAADGRILSPQ